MKVSIISVLYNHIDDITKPFIKQILEKTKEVDFELILIDNGNKSAQGYVRSLASRKITYKKMKENVGYAKACNIGYSLAKGDVIIFMNNDIVIEADTWLKPLSTLANDVLVGPQLVMDNSATIFRGRCISYLNGWFVAGTRQTWEKIKDENVWDEHFFLYFEDVELSYRAVLKGIELQETNLPVYHLVSKSSDKTPIATYTKFSKWYFENKAMVMYLEQQQKKRIVFYAPSAYPFTYSDYEGKGLGGAESSLVLLAHQFAKEGWEVEVYNITTEEKEDNGVWYRHKQSYKPHIYTDVFVLFREPYRFLEHVNAAQKLFWSCDQYTIGNWRQEIFPFVDSVIAISAYHKKYIDMRWGPVGKPIQVIDLGVNYQDYAEHLEKKPHKLIYCSVPRRGLHYLGGLFTKIQEQVPDAELVITSDYRLWGLDNPDNGEYMRDFANRPGVRFLGKVSRRELVKEQMEASVMAYPCNYEECFCISALECVASGAIPVTTDIGAMKTTVGNAGVVLTDMPGEPQYDERFVEEVTSLLTNSKKATEYRKIGRRRAKAYAWEEIYKQWTTYLKKLVKGGERMVTCDECGKEIKTEAALRMHKGKFHKAEEKALAVEDAVSTPQEEVKTTQLLKFKQPIKVQINGHIFEGTEITVPTEMVPSIMDIVMNRYGSNVLAL